MIEYIKFGIGFSIGAALFFILLLGIAFLIVVAKEYLHTRHLKQMMKGYKASMDQKITGASR